jgi:hypothetical protein
MEHPVQPRRWFVVEAQARIYVRGKRREMHLGAMFFENAGGGVEKSLTLGWFGTIHEWRGNKWRRRMKQLGLC